MAFTKRNNRSTVTIQQSMGRMVFNVLVGVTRDRRCITVVQQGHHLSFVVAKARLRPSDRAYYGFWQVVARHIHVHLDHII
jgi:hypothetical protein